MPSNSETQSPFSSEVGRTIHRREQEQRARSFSHEVQLQTTIARQQAEIQSQHLEQALAQGVRATVDPGDLVWTNTQGGHATAPTPREPREPQVYRNHSSNTLRFQCEGDSSLIAEVERCYNILSSFPAPQDRTEQQVEELMIALTEDVATVTVNHSPALEESRLSNTF